MFLTDSRGAEQKTQRLNTCLQRSESVLVLFVSTRQLLALFFAGARLWFRRYLREVDLEHGVRLKPPLLAEPLVPREDGPGPAASAARQTATAPLELRWNQIRAVSAFTVHEKLQLIAQHRVRSRFPH